MAKYIHNLSGGSKTYVGVEVANNAFYLIPDNKLGVYSNDDLLLTDLGSGDAKMSDDGTTDLAGGSADHINFLKDHVPVDSDGSPLSRTKTTKSGWHYQPHWVEITTGKLAANGGFYNKDIDGDDLGFATIKLYDYQDTEITVQATADTDCVKTVIDWMPTHDYEIIAAKLFQGAAPTGDVRIYVTAVPDLTPAQGGSIPFSDGGINLKMLAAGAAADTDGRSSKFMTYDATYKTNKFRITAKHGAGVNHAFAFLFEIFME